MSEEQVAVIGGGYAGFAAAVTLAAAGRRVVVFEAAKTLGGRARRVDLPDGPVDNGQHLLLGAYAQTLALLRTVHGARAEHELLDRRRLHLEQPGTFRFHAPALPAPWNLAAAIVSARGLSKRDKMATIAFVRRVRRGHYRCASHLSVASLLVDQPSQVIAMLWAPLCIAALNTPLDHASGQVFLNVLRAAFAAHARDSDLLLPRVDLSALFPDAAAIYIASRGGEVRVDRNVDRLAASDPGIAVKTAGGDESFAAAIVAVAPHQLYRLFDREPPPPPLRQALAQVAAFAYEPITTAYLRYPQPMALSQPMLRLDDTPGQWVFDRGQLGGPAGLAAVVISTDLPAATIEHPMLAVQMDAQLRRLLPTLPAPVWSRVIAERRATYACMAGLARPAPGAHGTSVYLAGDYTDSEFPATLEAATRSGVAAAKALLANLARVTPKAPAPVAFTG